MKDTLRNVEENGKLMRRVTEDGRKGYLKKITC